MCGTVDILVHGEVKQFGTSVPFQQQDRLSSFKDACYKNIVFTINFQNS